MCVLCVRNVWAVFRVAGAAGVISRARNAFVCMRECVKVCVLCVVLCCMWEFIDNVVVVVVVVGSSQPSVMCCEHGGIGAASRRHCVLSRLIGVFLCVCALGRGW